MKTIIWFILILSLIFIKSYQKESKIKKNLHQNMVFIKGGIFQMGGDNEQAQKDEYPKHTVNLNSFWMDVTEVTNAQFAQFVTETDYITTAEKKINWDELKKQLPEGTVKPSDEKLQPASLVFKPQNSDYWWQLENGVNWKHPSGKDFTIDVKNDYPVVQVSWHDAQAYSKWAKKRVPTEAEWEYAARGHLKNNIYSWGNESVDKGKPKTNNWQGEFPNNNLLIDNYYNSSPVKSFPSNGYGLYDMAGNVWEWCNDWYDSNYYKLVAKGIKNPKGPSKGNDIEDKKAPKRVLRGGSFLCNDGYCSGYRNARRMKDTPDTSMEHIGFRCVSSK